MNIGLDKSSLDKKLDEFLFTLTKMNIGKIIK